MVATKTKSVKDGDGVMSYERAFSWFVKTSGQALAARARRAGQPAVVVKGEMMMEATDAWENDVRMLMTYGDA